MKPRLFKSAADFRDWLEANHASKSELLVGFYKGGSGKKSITWPESVDQALCFGWIDGVRKTIDEQSYSIRFTPRKPTSVWSAVNIAKVEMLEKQGLMHPAGRAAFAKRKEEKSRIYSFENRVDGFSPELQKQFEASKAAWAFFSKQPPSYRKTLIHWVMSAKKDETKVSRLAKLIAMSDQGKRMK